MSDQSGPAAAAPGSVEAGVVAADGRAIVVSASGSIAPSGHRLTGPVDSVEKLGKLIEWATRNKWLKHEEGEQIPQIWIVGTQACALLGWDLDSAVAVDSEDDVAVSGGVIRGELTKRIAASAGTLMEQGWALRGGGHRIVLGHRAHGEAEVILEPYAWTAATEGSLGVLGADTPVAENGLPADDDAAAAELGRRLRTWHARFGVLPTPDPVSTAAVVADRLRDERIARNLKVREEKKKTLVAEAVALPAAVGKLNLDVQPRWDRIVTTDDDIDRPKADELIELDQLAGVLASAGMIDLGFGSPQHTTGEAAQALITGKKLPFALWHITLPAASTLDLPPRLPWPDPRMHPDRPVSAWVSTVELEGLCARVSDGGAGLVVTDLAVAEALVWAHQGRALAPWTTELRQGIEEFAAAADSALLELAETGAEAYLTHLADTDRWGDVERDHHLQPAWQAAITAHARFRGRRTAMRISREYGLWPLRVDGTRTVYAIGNDQDLSDDTTRLGRMIVARRALLSNDTILDLVNAVIADSVADSAAAIDRAFTPPTADIIPAHGPGRQHLRPAAHPHLVQEQPPDNEGPASEPDLAVAEETEPTEEPSADAAVPAVDEPDSDSAETVDEATGDEVRSELTLPTRITIAADTAAFTGPAAVLDVGVAWLADGTRHDLPDGMSHVGELVDFGHTLKLGTRLSPTFSEPGQIWITNELAARFGITDITAVSRRGRDADLRKLTADLPLVTDAVAAGWKLGGKRGESGDALGGWTRVWRDEQPVMWVVLMAGMSTRDDDMPILFDSPTPAALAHRLGLLAATLGFPWKVQASMTAIDMMNESRSKTWSPSEWRDVVMAGSTFTAPGKIIASDIEWTRQPTEAEAALRFLHGYDRGGSHTGAIAGLELPIGDPTHYETGEWEFDNRCPAYILTSIPEPLDWRYPNPLNPVAGRVFTAPQWVTTPTFDRARDLGYDLEILEAYVWQQHGRVLRGWYEPFSRATVELDVPDDPDAQATRRQAKLIRTAGVGMLASKHLTNRETGKPLPGYSPERRFHIIAKAVANIMYRVTEIGKVTDRWPVAITTDTIFYASDDPNPVTAWPMHDIEAADPPKRSSLGRGFGQYKPEVSGLMADQLPHLTGRTYKGKHLLTRYAEWATIDYKKAGEQT